MVRLKADNELKSAMFSGEYFHTSVIRFTKNDVPTLVLHRRLKSLCLRPLVWLNGAEFFDTKINRIQLMHAASYRS